MNETTQPAVAGPVEPTVRQHTQDGPWHDAGLTGPNPRITGGPLRLVKCEGVVIAFMPAWLGDEHEEAHANARLVAAAPELLAALEAITNDRGTWNCMPMHLRDLASAAMSKAAGNAA